jgi:hypothetical protein
MTSRFPAFPAIVWFLAATVTVGTAQQTQSRTISSTPMCARCTISIEPVATLRLPTDSLSFDVGARLLRLANGGFLASELTETHIPALFDASGTFVRLIARAGQGPSEIERSAQDPLVVGHGDSVWIFADGQRHVFTPDMRYVRKDVLNHVEGTPLALPNGTIVIAAVNVSPLGAGYPLHIINRTGDIVRSFGLDAPITDPRSQYAARSLFGREFTAGESGTFWVNRPTRGFLLEQYDVNGNLRARGTHALDGWYKEATEARYGSGSDSVLSVGIVQSSSQPGLLWLLYGVRNASFSRLSGTINVSTYSRMVDVMIEALDTQTFQVLATRRLPGTIATWIQNAPDMLAVVQPIDDIFHGFRLNTLRLIRP